LSPALRKEIELEAMVRIYGIPPREVEDMDVGRVRLWLKLTELRNLKRKEEEWFANAHRI